MGYGHTQIHPVALAFTILMGVAMLTVRRDRAAFPLLLVACLITNAQRIVIAGLDFSMLRILILFGWARVLSRGEVGTYRFHSLDGVLSTWLGFGLLASILGPRGSFALFVQNLGMALDAAGTYFLFRVLLRDMRDVERTVRAFGWLALLMVGPMIVERVTGRNVFSVLGGVPEFTRSRYGELRCQASFSHPIMVGNFGATTVALLGSFWVGFPKERLRTTLAIAAASTVTVLSSSSGPLMVLLCSFGAWALWRYRRFMRWIFWGNVALATVIHLARDKPIWHLIGRLSSITGGTGWHRVALISAFFENFGDWWLIGTGSTKSWKHMGGQDITNQYILEGVRGGLGKLLSFIAILVVGFRTVGQSLRRAEKRRDWSPTQRRRAGLLAWGLGVCLFAHTVAFVGVSYFGQLQSILYLHLAMIPSLYRALSRHRHPAPAAAEVAPGRSALAGPASRSVPRAGGRLPVPDRGSSLVRRETGLSPGAPVAPGRKSVESQ